MASVYIKQAYENDDNPEIVFVWETDDDKYISAIRQNGVWEKFGEMTPRTLNNDYREITDKAKVDQLITEARTALSRPLTE